MLYVISQMSNISNFDSRVFLFNPFKKGYQIYFKAHGAEPVLPLNIDYEPRNFYFQLIFCFHILYKIRCKQIKLPRKNRKMERKETTRKYRDAKKELTGKSFLLSSAWNIKKWRPLGTRSTTWPKFLLNVPVPSLLDGWGWMRSPYVERH